jgi:hypothetical protein
MPSVVAPCLIEVVAARPHTRTPITVDGAPDETYRQLLAAIDIA